MLLLATSLVLLVTSSLLNSVLCVPAASCVTCVSILKVSDYLIDPVTARHPAVV